jgi:hypothetical protein
MEERRYQGISSCSRRANEWAQRDDDDSNRHVKHAAQLRNLENRHNTWYINRIPTSTATINSPSHPSCPSLSMLIISLTYPSCKNPHLSAVPSNGSSITLILSPTPGSNLILHKTGRGRSSSSSTDEPGGIGSEGKISRMMVDARSSNVFRQCEAFQSGLCGLLCRTLQSKNSSGIVPRARKQEE